MNATARRVRVPTSQLRQDTALMNLLRDAVHAVQDEAGWARVGEVRAALAGALAQGLGEFAVRGVAAPGLTAAVLSHRSPRRPPRGWPGCR